MGTNYYWRKDICGCCKRHDEVHVGKSSAGWTFLFHIFKHELENKDHPEWGYNDESPFGRPVVSRADWIEIFKTTPGKLFNEYDVEIEHPITWIETLVVPSPEQIALEESRYYRPEEEHPRDPEGFRIESGEFS